MLELLENQKKQYEIYTQSGDEKINKIISTLIDDLKTLYNERQTEYLNLPIKEKIILILKGLSKYEDLNIDENEFNDLDNLKSILITWLKNMPYYTDGYDLSSVSYADENHKKNMEWKSHLRDPCKSYVNLNH